MSNLISEITKDFMSYQVTIKKGKKTIFDDEIFLSDSKYAINEALKFALSSFLGYKLSDFEIPSFRFDIFPTERSINQFGKDNLLFLNEKEVYVKVNNFEPTECRYALKGQTISFRNQNFPDWKYLTKKFSIRIELMIDQVGLDKALQNPESYVKAERQSNLATYHEPQSDSLFMI